MGLLTALPNPIHTQEGLAEYLWECEHAATSLNVLSSSVIAYRGNRGFPGRTVRGMVCIQNQQVPPLARAGGGSLAKHHGETSRVSLYRPCSPPQTGWQWWMWSETPSWGRALLLAARGCRWETNKAMCPSVVAADVLLPQTESVSLAHRFIKFFF